jgi:hypothetical protein
MLTGPEALVADQESGAIKASYPESTSYRPAAATTVVPALP